MAEEEKSFYIIISEDAYTSEKSFAGLRFALTAIVQGYNVKVFLLGSAVTLAIKGQNPQEGPNMQTWLQNIDEEGGEIVACGICCKSRGITKEILLDFVKIGSMGDLVEFAAQSDIQLMF
ncbi:MAG: DsrE/DsrF/TusD sulfur relay family protein [Promethearchaeota archaeon]